MRGQRGAVWPYLLLSVALVGATAFGWFQTNQKNRLALEAENKYMSAFHRLKWTSENIEERTARLMATNDQLLQQSLLADLRVFSAQAVEHMAALPFGTTQKPRIESFLNTLREKSDQYHYKLTEGASLSDAEWAQLTELRKQSVFFEEELSHLLGLVGNNMIRWRDTVRVTGPGRDGTAATPITKSIAHLEQALTPPPGEENALAPGKSPLARPRTDPGPRVVPARAVEAIKRFIDMPLQGEPQLTGSSDKADQGKEFSLYFFNAQKANGTPLNFGVSIHGGHVIYMIDGRPVKEKRLTRAQLVDRARSMLRKWGYGTAEFLSAAENSGTLVMDFAPLENGVSIHVDRIKVMLAMDNGELVGFDARSYWINRHARNIGGPKLLAMEAGQRLSPRLKVKGEPQLAIIADTRRQERLVWAFHGSIDAQHYRVFVDAQTGREVDVERLSGDPAPPLNEG